MDQTNQEKELEKPEKIKNKSILKKKNKSYWIKELIKAVKELGLTFFEHKLDELEVEDKKDKRDFKFNLVYIKTETCKWFTLIIIVTIFLIIILGFSGYLILYDDKSLGKDILFYTMSYVAGLLAGMGFVKFKKSNSSDD